MEGKTALGASSPANPALHIPDPLSQTRAATSSSHMFVTVVIGDELKVLLEWFLTESGTEGTSQSAIYTYSVSSAPPSLSLHWLITNLTRCSPLSHDPSPLPLYSTPLLYLSRSRLDLGTASSCDVTRGGITRSWHGVCKYRQSEPLTNRRHHARDSRCFCEPLEREGNQVILA